MKEDVATYNCSPYTVLAAERRRQVWEGCVVCTYIPGRVSVAEFCKSEWASSRDQSGRCPP